MVCLWVFSEGSCVPPAEWAHLVVALENRREKAMHRGEGGGQLVQSESVDYLRDRAIHGGGTGHDAGLGEGSTVMDLSSSREGLRSSQGGGVPMPLGVLDALDAGAKAAKSHDGSVGYCSAEGVGQLFFVWVELKEGVGQEGS